MTLTLFLTLLTILALVVSLFTEAVKKFLKGMKVTYSSNIVVLLVSLVVGIGGTALAYMFMAIPFTTPNIVCMLLMGIVVWVGAMMGYDKVIQLIEQICSVKKK